MKNLIWLFGILLVATACDTQTEVKTETEEVSPSTEQPKYIGDNSHVSLDWNGTYKGTLPCADCEGIETILTLNNDETYLLKSIYLGRNDALEQELSGPFEWDETGSIITLIHMGKTEGKYKVGENRLWFLDQSGEIITGDLADYYILTKQ
ncbi:copper resistance protein NlpE [Algoriphagus sediminis]|uniref:Copper resistance protein NlpE n=1 Tax=Algoriphagus sediminis TaxID=3057113 RepID=A0ABT7YBT2_9BACT|nr:copper resistance protein NlpE [Algoriphagus sediminis]MDN3203992.1 copper resistance protein NlpE [Algoriphagus sediminis]